METVLGTVVGTVGYMSPEQARGEPTSPPSDIYSLGLLVQEILTGRAPYERGSTVREVLVATAMGVSAPVEGLPTDLVQTIEAMKAVNPEDRPTAPVVRDRLRRIIDTPRRRLRWAVAMIALAITIGGSAKYAWDLNRERTAALEAQSQALIAREDAEELMTFMLQDLYDGLVPLGRLDLLEQVSQQALEYYKPERQGDRRSPQRAEDRKKPGIAQHRTSVRNIKGFLDQAEDSLPRASQRISDCPRDVESGRSRCSGRIGPRVLQGIGQVETMRGEVDSSAEFI